MKSYSFTPISSNKDSLPTNVPPTSTQARPESPTPSLRILTPTPTITPVLSKTTSKKSYTIAVFGDSMVDTMGELLEYLEHSLKRTYPLTNFGLFNYGVGAQNVELGLNRFGNELHYQTRNYPPLPTLKPDIIIVGSFAYNPFTPHDRDKHWLTLTKLVEEARRVTPNVYILAEIAPLRGDFGKGPNGVNWETDTVYQHSGRIIEQLQNAVGIGKTLNVPVIDAFGKTFNPATKEGVRKYVNSADGIHPSIEGHEFTADLITGTIVLP